MDRDLFLNDPHRPRYHFLPPAHWMNDPNGLVHWDGEYHIFYQHNPLAAVWGPMHWGHAVSRDLVHWEDLPIALSPTPDGPDRDGCWSGVVINHQGTPTIIYSGNRDGVQLPCMATSADNLRTWVKHPANPLLAGYPPGLQVAAFRDHCLWQDGGGWYQLIGAGLSDQGGAALLYRSDDLISWEYLGPIMVGDPAQTGTIWECPDLIPFGDQHVLVISPIPLQRSLALIGRFDGRTFSPQQIQEVDAGGHLYAPLSFSDGQGRRIMFGWLWEARSREAQLDAGWAGVMSLPRVLSLEGGRLHAEPLPELAQLRQRERQHAPVALAPDIATSIEDAAGDSYELQLAVELGSATAISLGVRRSPDGGEETRIIYDIAHGRLEIDRSRASQDASLPSEAFGVDYTPTDAGLLELRVFVDHSVVEVYAQGTCLTTRIYPMRADSLGVAVTAQGGTGVVRSLQIWDMRPIW
jgi:beta-fructofuranosidase